LETAPVDDPEDQGEAWLRSGFVDLYRHLRPAPVGSALAFPNPFLGMQAAFLFFMHISCVARIEVANARNTDNLSA
jgi:hypothetical protein